MSIGPAAATLNRSVISRLAAFIYDQKLASCELPVEELFPPQCRKLTEQLCG